MAWVRATFKGKEVWAEADAGGAPLVEAGRRNIRYNEAPGAKIYRAGASGVTDQPGAARELPAGTEAPAEGAAGATPAAGGGRPKRGSGFGSAGSRTAAQTEAAKVDAKKKIAELPPGTILAFTDGACQGNPGPAGSGVVVRLADGRHIERHKALGEGTNNIGELVAIGVALEILREQAIPRDAPVALFTDSDYSIGVLTRGWKAKANIGLIAGLKRAVAEWSNLTIYWVAGHAGVAENERADALARKGVEESRRM